MKPGARRDTGRVRGAGMIRFLTRLFRRRQAVSPDCRWCGGINTVKVTQLGHLQMYYDCVQCGAFHGARTETVRRPSRISGLRELLKIEADSQKWAAGFYAVGSPTDKWFRDWPEAAKLLGKDKP